MRATNESRTPSARVDPVRRTDLLREWRAAGPMSLIRSGGRHDLLDVGGVQVAVPRHGEICAGLVRALREKVSR